ncbi:MAG: hypothetical protein SGI88_20260, partial [Candidatus Hydrogenedentes bacterium]|nr:hypothetical protein [Candidatus Hydrogenedentota bacterium]
RETRRTRGVVWATVESILSPSPDRTVAPCELFGRCGGCTWLHFAYPAQLHWKRTIVSETLRRIGGIEAEVIAMEEPALRLGYRTRAEFHGGTNTRGFYAIGTHDVVDVSACPLCHAGLNAALGVLRAGHVEGSVTITVNPEGEEVLIWTSRHNPGVEKIFPGAQSMQSAGPRNQFIFDGVPVVNGAFSQSSLLLNRMLRDTVANSAGDARRVLDLYCGTGNLSLSLDAEVLGLDHNQASVTAARAMMRGEYKVGGTPEFIREIAANPWDAIILDPPREGAKSIMPAVSVSNANTVIYVSCDPATLARDAKTMVAGGWRVQTVSALDMFPHTSHIETVCVFERE